MIRVQRENISQTMRIQTLQQALLDIRQDPALSPDILLKRFQENPQLVSIFTESHQSERHNHSHSGGSGPKKPTDKLITPKKPENLHMLAPVTSHLEVPEVDGELGERLLFEMPEDESPTLAHSQGKKHKRAAPILEDEIDLTSELLFLQLETSDIDDSATMGHQIHPEDADHHSGTPSSNPRGRDQYHGNLTKEDAIAKLFQLGRQTNAFDGVVDELLASEAEEA